MELAKLNMLCIDVMSVEIVSIAYATVASEIIRVCIFFFFTRNTNFFRIVHINSLCFLFRLFHHSYTQDKSVEASHI
ncbi:MAG: hypothetical protein HQ589_05210 [Syntrophaceae bacterium]|nr:hypothetical protein [Syntrophaceae bacterium]